jgi:hypothetical protein
VPKPFVINFWDPFANAMVIANIGDPRKRIPGERS